MFDDEITRKLREFTGHIVRDFILEWYVFTVFKLKNLFSYYYVIVFGYMLQCYFIHELNDSFNYFY